MFSKDVWLVGFAILGIAWVGYVAVIDPKVTGAGGFRDTGGVMAGFNGNSARSVLFALPFVACGIRQFAGDTSCID